MTQSASSEPQPSATLVEFSIASQPLAQALNAWAQQSGLQLIWPAGNVARMQSRSLYGKYEPMRALALLLQDSGLKYSVLGEGTVTVADPNSNRPTTVSAQGRSD
jgi:iron complex outermembrane receptor protein